MLKIKIEFVFTVPSFSHIMYNNDKIIFDFRLLCLLLIDLMLLSVVLLMLSGEFVSLKRLR